MTSAHDERPRPQYGEYAEPEAGTPGSTAEPDGNSTDSAATTVPPAANASPVSTPATAPAPQPPSTPNRLPGVPHNLGVPGGGAAVPARSPQIGEPYRSADPTPQAGPANLANTAPSSAPTTPAATQTEPAANSPARPRGADRIITVALLVLGGYFALSMAFSLSQFPSEFAKIAGDLGLTDFTAPPQVRVIGTVGAILVLSIYALVLIFSIRRLRARKLTFWAPLAAGVLAWVIFFVLFAIGLGQSTELWQELMRIASDPEKAQQLLDQLSKRP